MPQPAFRSRSAHRLLVANEESRGHTTRIVAIATLEETGPTFAAFHTRGVADPLSNRYEQSPPISNKGRSSLAKAQNTQARKKTAATPRTATVRPVKDVLSKSALIERIATENDIPRSTAKGVLTSLETALFGSVHRRGVGEFTWPGVLKVALRKVPARKAGTLVRNPATGEMTPGAARPASVRVKIRALSKLKSAASL